MSTSTTSMANVVTNAPGVPAPREAAPRTAPAAPQAFAACPCCGAQATEPCPAGGGPVPSMADTLPAPHAQPVRSERSQANGV